MAVEDVPNDKKEERVLQEKHEMDEQRWCGVVTHYVSWDLFKYVQFVNRDKDIEMGSVIQKLCARTVIFPNKIKYSSGQAWASRQH
jgi:hypothetical protein